MMGVTGAFPLDYRFVRSREKQEVQGPILPPTYS